MLSLKKATQSLLILQMPVESGKLSRRELHYFLLVCRQSLSENGGVEIIFRCVFNDLYHIAALQSMRGFTFEPELWDPKFTFYKKPSF